MVHVSEILLASDFSARSDRPLDRALQLAEQWRAPLVIAHVVEKGERGLMARVAERLRADLPEAARQAELVVESGSAPKVLARIADERRSSLIVTGVARYNSLGDYALGTAVDHIIRNASTPVLVVKCRAARPYRRLLVATDLSDCSRAALLKAMELFPDAEVTLMHAYHVPFEGLLKSDQVQADVREDACRQLDAFLAHPAVGPQYRERIEALLVEGEIEDAVAQTLRERDIDLLVMGAHGRSGFFHATIGSQAENLLRISDADTLVVREAKP